MRNHPNLDTVYFTPSLNLRKIQQVAVLSLKNGIRLHFDSLHLFNVKSYPTALFISVIAMEEIGKAFWADHMAWSQKVHSRSSYEFERDWLNLMFSDHRGKQLAFIRHIFPHSEYLKHYALIESKGLEQLKHNSIYVGLTKPSANQPKTDGKIINPSNISMSKAKKQIKFVNDFLFECAEGNEEWLHFDLRGFRRVFNKRLLEELQGVNL